MRDTYTRLTYISTASIRLTYLPEAGAVGETTSCALLPKYTKSDQHTEGKRATEFQHASLTATTRLFYEEKKI